MKVAFLFEETYTNYDLTLRVIQAIPVEEREAMDSLISTGLWGINEVAEQIGLGTVDELKALIFNLIHNQEGSLTRVATGKSIAEMARSDVFAVIFDSIDRALTLRLHDLLKTIEHYRGLVQVLPHHPWHPLVFGGFPPSMRLEANSLFVWSSEDPHDSDEEGEEARLRDEIVEWAQAKYPLLGLSIRKKAIGFKESVFDRDSDDNFDAQQGVEGLVGECTRIAEHVIYKLGDFAPDVVQELNSALKRLDRPNLSAAECGQVAVSLRRSLELLAHILYAGTPERLAQIMSRPEPEQEKYKGLIWAYLDERFPEDHQTGWDIVRELKSLDRMLNKGVHEHWISTLIRPLAIRTILVMNSLLFPVKAGVVQWRAGDDLFD